MRLACGAEEPSRQAWNWHYTEKADGTSNDYLGGKSAVSCEPDARDKPGRYH